MPLNLAMSALSAVECILWVLLGSLFWRKNLQRRFPVMGSYLMLHVFSTPVLWVLFVGQSRHWFSDYCYVIYFFAFWAVYIVSAVMLYFVCLEVFRSALSGFPGLFKFGAVIFRWVALVSTVVSFSSLPLSHRGIMLLFGFAYRLMRSVSLIELCLLAFLCLSMNALKLSSRDLCFGIALGFGLMSTSDLINSLVMRASTSLTAPWQFAYESLILVSLGIWVAYVASPEPVRRPVVLPANSTVHRWNEIASALGHTGTQVAVRQYPDGFFLSDVERVVDKVLNRTLKGKESES